MGLQPVKETLADGLVVFAKILENILGGVSLVTSNLASGVTIPKGAMLSIDEATRLATVVKTGKATRKGTGTGVSLTNHYINDGHLFQVGDYVGFTWGAGARKITKIVATTVAGVSSWKLTVPTSGSTAGIGTGYAAGAVVFETATGTDAASALKAYPNYLLRDSVIAQAGEFVNAVLRGTVYGRRMQPYLDEHLTNLKHIHVSDSY